jgi:hypothetical protein
VTVAKEMAGTVEEMMEEESMEEASQGDKEGDCDNGSQGDKEASTEELGYDAEDMDIPQESTVVPVLINMAVTAI